MTSQLLQDDDCGLAQNGSSTTEQPGGEAMLYSGVLKWLRSGRQRKPAERAWFGPYSAGLWGEVEDALSYCPGETPYQALNRYARKHVARGTIETVPDIDRDGFAIEEQYWSAGKMSERLLPAEHRLRHPRDEDRPIIVLRCVERFLLLDGRTRVNKWLSENAGRRRVIVITPRATDERAFG
jgi:hypothetical protein